MKCLRWGDPMLVLTFNNISRSITVMFKEIAKLCLYSDYNVVYQS